MEKLKRLPDSELEIMLIIWHGGERTSTSDIMAQVRGEKSVQLVQNTLGRLETKGFLRCEKLGRLNHYTPLVELGDYRAQETADFVEKLYLNSPTKLFAALLESHSISEPELAEIRALLAKEDDREC